MNVDDVFQRKRVKFEESADFLNRAAVTQPGYVDPGDRSPPKNWFDSRDAGQRFFFEFGRAEAEDSNFWFLCIRIGLDRPGTAPASVWRRKSARRTCRPACLRSFMGVLSADVNSDSQPSIRSKVR